MLKVSPQGTIELISVNDQAIALDRLENGDGIVDDGSERLDRYIETRNREDLRLIPSVDPVVWRFRAIGGRARAFIEDSFMPRIKHQRAFQCALDSVDGLKRPDGSPWTPTHVTVEKRRVLTDASMEELEDFGLAALINEFGGVVYQRAYMDPFGGEKYSLPPGCTVNLARRSTATSTPTTTN